VATETKWRKFRAFDGTWKWRFLQELNAQEKPEAAHMARNPRYSDGSGW
jgi:hypothetical protein